jgi:hypothetical protein
VITFRRLEALGRLGNQLWQIAVTISVGARRGDSVVLPRWSYARYFSVPDHFWADDVPSRATDVETLTELHHIAERHRPYMQDLSLIGDHEMIRSYFAPSPLGRAILDAKWPGFMDSASNRVCLHSRRGDALAVPHLYPVQTPGYYKAALDTIGVNGPISMFGDDHSWMRASLGFTGATCMPGNGDWEDLCLMAACRGGHVISNSSFAWWGAFLSGDPVVRYPAVWYGRDFHDINIGVMMPADWAPVADPGVRPQTRTYVR